MNFRFSRALPPGGLAHARPDDLEAFPSGLGHAASGTTEKQLERMGRAIAVVGGARVVGGGGSVKNSKVWAFTSHKN